MSDNQKAFAKLKKLQFSIGIIGALIAVTLFVLQLQPLAVFIVVTTVILTRVNWRCPNCKKYLGKGSNPKHCSHCGEILQ